MTSPRQLVRRAAERAGSVRRRSAGFTLIEILVVMVIIAVIAAGAILSMSAFGIGQDRELDTERDRLVALINYAREQSELQTRELGLYCAADGYRFLAFDPLSQLWSDVKEDDALRPRSLPDGMQLRLNVEAHDVVLLTTAEAKKKHTEPKDLQPHVMIFSNGDLTSFALTLERAGGNRSVVLTPDEQGNVSARTVTENNT